MKTKSYSKKPIKEEIKTLSIIIPCFNEHNKISKMIAEIQKVPLVAMKKEIIIVDDFSTDGSRKEIQNLSYDNVKIILHDKNYGKTKALKTAIKEVTGDLIIIQDADLEYDPFDYQRLVRPFFMGQADVVYGSRFIPGYPRKRTQLLNTLGNIFMTKLSNLLTGIHLTDIHTCYIMLKAELAKELFPKLKSDRWGFNVEILSKFAKYPKKLNIFEVGISYYGRTKAEGKKITFKDGIEAIKDIIYYNLFTKN